MLIQNLSQRYTNLKYVYSYAVNKVIQLVVNIERGGK